MAILPLFGSLPQGIRQALASNNYPVEFDMLTDNFLASPTARRLRFTTNILVDPGNSNYESTQLDLSLDEWQQSARRWLDHLKTNQKEYFLPWKRLYDTHMFGSNALTRPWAELMFYDSKLRECCKPIGENEPFWGYSNLWTMAEAYSESVERKKMEQRTAKMMEEQIGQAVRRDTQQGPSTAKQHYAYKPTTTQTQDQNSTSQSLITYPSQATAGSGPYSFQDKHRLTWCFRCACEEHQPEDCQASTTRSGRRLASKKGDDGHFSLLDGTRFCYSYNNPGGCKSKGKCVKGEHVCGTCGSTSHGARTCTA
jgi:hypothetical protein